VVRFGDALTDLHRYPEALALADEALGRAGGAALVATAYDDAERQLPWVMQMRAGVLFDLGRYDEAVAQWQRALATDKQQPANHAIRLAWAFTQLDRPEDALTVLPTYETATAFQRAWIELIRVAAAAGQNDPSAQEAALTALRTYQASYPGLVQRGLLISGQMDEAAHLMVSRLADPVLRADALLELQDYVSSPAPPRTMLWRTRLKALREREDVRAQLRAVGRVQSYKIDEVMF
jgi:tetratricopeptide (TPR) repeat protein